MSEQRYWCGAAPCHDDIEHTIAVHGPVTLPRPPDEDAVRAVAWYLQWHAQTAARTPTPDNWPGSYYSDGEPFWLHVARAAVSMGARAELLPPHGPVRPLDGSEAAANGPMRNR